MMVVSDFDRRQGLLARNRALILRVVKAEPGLTYEKIGQRINMRWKFLPTVGNRVRELRVMGWVRTVKEEDGRLHVYHVNGDCEAPES